jgi:hypothetical protein
MYFANADISGPVGLGDEAGWDDVIEINLQAHVRAARTLVPRWLDRGEGYFLSMASAAGLLTQIGAAGTRRPSTLPLRSPSGSRSPTATPGSGRPDAAPSAWPPTCSPTGSRATTNLPGDEVEGFVSQWRTILYEAECLAPSWPVEYGTGMGQHVDVAMAATLALNERLHSAVSDIDRDGEPDALSAAQSPIFRMPGGTRITIVCTRPTRPSSTATAR